MTSIVMHKLENSSSEFRVTIDPLKSFLFRNKFQLNYLHRLKKNQVLFSSLLGVVIVYFIDAR